MAELLDQIDLEGPRAAAAFLRAHPLDAAGLRRRLLGLIRLGLVPLRPEELEAGEEGQAS